MHIIGRRRAFSNALTLLYKFISRLF